MSEQSTTELLKKVRKIEIKTRGLSNHIFAGEYHSAFKGRGMAFSEVRSYQHGDDVRTIDWNVTARFDEPHVKVFEEEREMVVIFLVDVSASKHFGTSVRNKQELATEICATLAFSAIQNNDKVGVLFFSDKVEKFIPPKKGKGHILHIIRDLISFKPENKQTDIAEALRFFSGAIKKKATVFLLSDFIAADNYDDLFKIVAKRHDLIVLKLADQREETIPSMGWVPFEDAETGEVKWVNTSKKNVRETFQIKAREKSEFFEQKCKKSGIDQTTIYTHEDYVKPLMKLFGKR